MADKALDEPRDWRAERAQYLETIRQLTNAIERLTTPMYTVSSSIEIPTEAAPQNLVELVPKTPCPHCGYK